MIKLNRCILILIPLLLLPGPSIAYIGPGAGLTALGCLIALFAGFWYIFLALVWLPLKGFIQKHRKKSDVDESNTETKENNK
jgi:hypothetical protein